MKNIERDFSLRPMNEYQTYRAMEIRKQAKQLAAMIESACKEGMEKSIAFTKLEECVMWVDASLKRE